MAAILATTVSLITIGKVIFELSKTLTKLSLSVEELNATLSSLASDNAIEHEELFGAIEELSENYKKLDEEAEKRKI